MLTRGTVPHDVRCCVVWCGARQLGGTPSEVLDNRELMDLFLPMLRADFKMVDDYCSGACRGAVHAWKPCTRACLTPCGVGSRAGEHPPVKCDITSMLGTTDVRAGSSIPP